MAQNKFLTIDLATGKRVLKNLEASLVNFDPSGLSGISGTNLQDALKQEVTRALAAEGVLNESITNAIATAKTADDAIKALIGAIPEQSTVKAELDRIEGLVTALTSTVTTHTGNSEIHITNDERTKWNKVISDLATETSERKSADSTLDGKITSLTSTVEAKADKNTVDTELAKKVEKTELFTDGKIKTDLLPSIAINNTIVVNTAEEAMQATIENGDVIIINPNLETLEIGGDLPTSGTFICVDILAQTFSERFRQLYSNSDSINKADAQQMVNIEKDRALAAEAALDQKITDEKNEGKTGSLANKIKANADAIATEISNREEADRAINSQIETLRGQINKIQSQEEFTIALTASGIQVGDLLSIKSEDGSIVKATADNDNVVGIAVEVQERDVRTAIMGKVDVSAFKVLIPGKDYFLNTDGTITEICPQDSGKHIIKVGKAISKTELFVKIEDAIEIL